MDTFIDKISHILFTFASNYAKPFHLSPKG